MKFRNIDLPIFEYCLLFGVVVPLQLEDYQLLYD